MRFRRLAVVHLTCLALAAHRGGDAAAHPGSDRPEAAPYQSAAPVAGAADW